MDPVSIPHELKERTNKVDKRILFLSPSVLNGEENEPKREDFQAV